MKHERFQNLTENEMLVVGIISDYGDSYDGKLYMDFSDICSTVHDPKILRGVISSLVKKGLVRVERDFFAKGCTAIFLNN
jgi:hypothetical protein